MDKSKATQILLDRVTELADLSDDTDSRTWQAACDRVARAWDSVRDPEHGSVSTTISDFFGSIGSGLIEAQKNLDKESERYVKRALRLTDSDGDGAIPATATMFRIPRVNAELKCSLETDVEKKLNLIFYSNRQDVRELHQQTVNLEVVSVPAPPDYINALRSAPKQVAAPKPDLKIGMGFKGTTGTSTLADSSSTTPIPAASGTADSKPLAGRRVFTFGDSGPDDEEDEKASAASLLPAGWQGRIADAAARSAARAEIESLDLKQNGQRRSLVKDLLLPSWRKAVLFTDGNNARFIALALEGKRPELLLWELLLRPSSLQLMYRMPAAQKVRRAMSRLRHLVADIGATQDKRATKA